MKRKQNATLDPRSVRLLARVTQMQVAVHAGVSVPLVRLFEAAGGHVSNYEKDRALKAFYAALAGETVAANG